MKKHTYPNKTQKYQQVSYILKAKKDLGGREKSKNEQLKIIQGYRRKKEEQRCGCKKKIEEIQREKHKEIKC